MTQINETIDEWINDGNPPQLPLGEITWRVYTLVAKMPDTQEAERVRLEHDLGISYAMGYQLNHIAQIEPIGLQLIGLAYQALRTHYISEREKDNGSTN